MMRLIVILISIFLPFSGTGQVKYSKQELIQMMKEGKYPEAFETLEDCAVRFPKDPDYTFYAGVCRVMLNARISGAVDLLTSSANQGKYNESWFYLGRAHMLNYDFSKAAEAFERFNGKATREEKEKVQLQLYQAMCRNAIDICSRNRNLNVVKVDTVPENNLTGFLNKHQMNGKLERLAETEKGQSRQREGYKFSSGSKVFQTRQAFGKKQKDIFISEEDEIELNKSKSIGNIINSAGDEDFVYYDETVPALYFSSQGHNSAGGYDVFVSYYDKQGKKWSKPKNMGFPINTPFDEIAWVNITGTNRSLLASRRNAVPGKIVVYTLEDVDKATEEEILTTSAAQLAQLKPGAMKISGTGKNQQAEKKNVVSNKNEVPAELRNEQSYQRYIREALTLQIRSDSIRRISDEKKEQLVSAKFESDRTRLWQEIKTLDTRADEIQLKADALYKKARELETEKQEKINAQELAQKAFAGKNNTGPKPPANHTTGQTTASTASSEAHDIFYRIQVGVFSKPPPGELFRGFSDVYNEKVMDGNAVKYYVGLYRKIGEAEKGLVKVKEAGFKDAYIIGYYNGKIVPLSRARELELSLQK